MKQQRTFTTGGNQYQVQIEIDENALIDQTMNELNEAINYYTEEEGLSVQEAITAVHGQLGDRMTTIASVNIRAQPIQN